MPAATHRPPVSAAIIALGFVNARATPSAASANVRTVVVDRWVSHQRREPVLLAAQFHWVFLPQGHPNARKCRRQIGRACQHLGVLPLDNPVWSSLTGAHEPFAETSGRARRYPLDLAPFGAIVDDNSWPDLAVLVGPGNVAVLFQPGLTPDPDWHEQFRMPIRQMVATTGIAPPSEPLDTLASHDVPDMLALVEETRPGPFGPRTIDFGGYLGVRDNGQIVAMAGERMRPQGYGEISAVCTRSTHRGQGLASTLVRGVATVIQTRGDIPILHVLDTNIGAIRVYEQLGFETRTTFEVLGLRAPSP